MSSCTCETTINQIMDYTGLRNSGFRNLYISSKMLLDHHMNRNQDIEYWFWNARYAPFERDSEKLLEILAILESIAP